ncbi:hypothetical protein I6A60_21035 [Frankia sp. AgB1.9]|uniref:hypothetical protein n=1 Tax=unclassified Frankia TaxID=2632575 RepID=UPI001932F1F2|nr:MULTISPECIES: hypothetical protein [unclassified Frankia]MBL7490780.1 hypothetical protein [Frankia sp. AgW1.1]MBL7550341.1 hypothetical protein [Frankia sp. AgB1.9]MBL7621014.1 hypothetical protein [Frankia sp. AgB1.8]
MLPGGELDQLVRMFCPQCADERPFERPECLDGHGADCPERACVECGAAVLLGPLTQPERARATGQDRPGQRVVRPAVIDLGVPAQSMPSQAMPAQSTPAESTPAQPETRRRVGSGRTPRSLA